MHPALVVGAAEMDDAEARIPGHQPRGIGGAERILLLPQVADDADLEAALGRRQPARQRRRGLMDHMELVREPRRDVAIDALVQAH